PRRAGGGRALRPDALRPVPGAAADRNQKKFPDGHAGDVLVMFSSAAELRPLASSRPFPTARVRPSPPEGRTRGFFAGGRDLPSTGEVTRMGGLFRAPKPVI